jgi:hypothetical protein
MRTDTAAIGFKGGELDGRHRPRAQRVVDLLDAAAPTRLTANLFR